MPTKPAVAILISRLLLAAGLLHVFHLPAASQNVPQTAGAVNLSVLAPGTYGVGFKTFFAEDPSRTWKITRRYDQPFSADENGRPVRIAVWYPASKSSSSKPMLYRDYIESGAPQKFEKVGEFLEQRDRTIAKLSVPAARLDDLMASSVSAVRDAPPADGRFPLVVYFPGANDSQDLNVFVLAEYLATRGYVVASVSLLGMNEEKPDQPISATGIELGIRDGEFAWSLLRSQTFVDPEKLAAMGHSLGAIQSAALASRNANVSAVIGMDGTYGFAQGTKFLTGFYSYSPRNFSAALLDLRRDANQGRATLDLSPVEAMAFSDRTLITLDSMHHSDFTSFAVVAKVFGLPDTYTPTPGEHPWSRESGYRGYLLACQIVKDYLDSTFMHPDDGSAQLRADIAQTQNVTYKHIAATPAPPSTDDFLRMIHTQGLDSTIALAKKLAAQAPMEWIVDEQALNSYGYQLLNTNNAADAVAIFDLNAETHPGSANAADSLADGYVGTKNTDKAIAGYQKAIDLLAKDPAFDENAKKSFADDERKKIEKLKADAK